MEKRAISTVVATVLIILITVAAVTIIWAAIIPMIKDKLISGTDCMDAQAELSLVADEGYTCRLNNSNGTIQLQVKRGAKDFVLAGINAYISIKGDSKATGKLPNSNLSANTGDVFYVGDSSSHNYINATRVQIAPIIRSGNVEKECDATESAKLEECQA